MERERERERESEGERKAREKEGEREWRTERKGRSESEKERERNRGGGIEGGREGERVRNICPPPPPNKNLEINPGIHTRCGEIFYANLKACSKLIESIRPLSKKSYV